MLMTVSPLRQTITLQRSWTEFNNYNGTLQFTIAITNENKLNFLDTTLHHILTKWYTKPTCSSRYINFWPEQPLCYKKV